MGDFPLVVAVITTTIPCLSLAALLARLPRARRRCSGPSWGRCSGPSRGSAEPAWLAGLLACVALRAALPLPGPAAMVAGLAMAWLAGGFAARAAGERVRASWHACAAAPAAVILAALAAGPGSTVLVTVFHAAALAFLASLRAPTLLRAWKATRSAALAVALGASACWGAASLAARLSRAGGPVAAAAEVGAAASLLLLAACLAVPVLVQGYPWPGGFSGRSSRAAAGGRPLAPAWARLLEAEDALARQDGLVASGFLALGAAHEFKNSLALVRASAEHGLEAASPAGKDESLRLVVEQADAGSAAAIAFLERLAREGRGEERVLEAREELDGLLRLCRASIRGEGIVLRAELAEGVRFRGRPGEPARIVLALVENAVQVLRAAGRAGGCVRVHVEARAGLAVIEVRDNGGGIAPRDAARLFTPGASSTGGTGVGLVIARGLAERGGGALSWSPLDGGSCFRLCFPLAPEGPVVA